MACCTIAARAQTSDLEHINRQVDALSAQTLLAAPVDQLLDVRRQHLAEALGARRPTLFFASAFLEIAALLYLWRSGRAAQLRDALRRRLRNVQLLRLSYVWVVAMLAQIASLPAGIVQYRLEAAAGTTIQSPAEWLGQATSTAVADAIMAAIVFSIMLALAERTRLWYLFGAAFLTFFILLAAFGAPVVFSPFVLHQQPIGFSTPIGARLYALEHRIGVQARIVAEGVSTGTGSDTSRLAGIGPTQQIDISEGLLASATPGELAFVVARQSAHIASNDVLRLDLYAALWLIVAAAVSVTVADRIGFRRDDDPLSRLSLLGSVLGIAILALLPLENAYSRRLEARADRAAIVATQDPASAVRLMVRLADVDLLRACPRPFVRRYFLSDPPIASRIAAIRGGGDPCP